MAASPALVVFATALATALATGAGALPFAFGRAGMQRWLGAGNAIASGVMLGASAGLVIEGVHRDTMRTVIGALAGAVFAHLAYTFTARHHNPRMGVLRGANARNAILIVAVMTAHSAAEGIGIGAAFGGSGAFGLVIPSHWSRSPHSSSLNSSPRCSPSAWALQQGRWSGWWPASSCPKRSLVDLGVLSFGTRRFPLRSCF